MIKFSLIYGSSTVLKVSSRVTRLVKPMTDVDPFAGDPLMLRDFVLLLWWECDRRPIHGCSLTPVGKI